MMPKWLVTGLMIVGFFFAVSPVTAQSGTPPTLDCTNNAYTNDATYAYKLGLSASVVDSQNNVFVVVNKDEKAADNDQTLFIAKFNENCTLVWETTSAKCDTDVAGSDVCTIDGLHIDHGGRLVYTVSWDPFDGPEETYIEIRNADTAALLERSADLALLSPAWTDIRDVISVRNGTSDTDINYIATDRGADRMARFNANLSYRSFTVTQVDVTWLGCCTNYTSESHIFVGGDAATERWSKIDKVDGSQDANVGFSGFTSLDAKVPTLSYLSSTEALGGATTGTAGSTQVAYRRLNTSTWAAPLTAFSPSQIWSVGSLRDTDPFTYALDSANQMIVCGEYTNGGPWAFFGGFDTTTNNMSWNISFLDEPGHDTNSQIAGCGIDYDGGSWIWMGIDSEDMEFRRYDGGGFSGIAERRNLVSLPTTPGATSPFGTGNPIENIVENFNEAWGFDGSILFGIACVGMVSVGFARIGKNPVPLLVAIGGVLGVILGTVLGFFQEWVLFLVAFLIIAIAGRQLFGGDSE